MEKRKMSVFQLTIITMVNLLGAGIIMLPAKLAAVGSISVISWLVTLTGAMCLAYIYARLGTYGHNRKNGMGGYSENTFGKFGNFIINYSYGVSLIFANVAIAVAAVGYVSTFLGWSLSSMDIVIWTIVILFIATIANYWGPRVTGRIGSVTVWFVIIPVGFIAIFGWFWFSGHTFATSWNPHHLNLWSGITESVPITLWSFLGLESAASNSDAMENPERNVPIAVLGGTLAAGIIYILSTNVAQGIIGHATLAKSNAPFGLVYASILSPVFGKIVMAMMTISCIGALLGWQFTISENFRVSTVAGYFPKFFKLVNAHGAPFVGMLTIMVIEFVLSFMTINPTLNEQFNQLVNLAVVLNLVPYLLCMASLKVTEVNQMKLGRSVPFHRTTMFIAFIAGVYSIYSMYDCGIGILAAGSLVVYFGMLVYGLIADRFTGFTL